MDSCMRLLKCVLIHTGNQFASVPLKVKYVLEKVSYQQHVWYSCVDLKMALQSFLHLWDSRDWPAREELVPGRSKKQGTIPTFAYQA